MLFSLEGRLRKTSVPVSRPLLPVFEAIANSVHSIQQAKRQDGAITVTFRRADTLLEEKSAGAIESVEIRDNGAGFTPKNYEAFQTADTTFKLDKGGKGVGRFTWLVAFSKAKIESRHGAGDCWRAFEFSPEAGIQLVDAYDPSSLSAPGTVLTLVDFKSPWRERCPARLELIAADIIEHFIAMFVSATCPKITVIDDSGNIELRAEFARAYDRDLKRSQFKVGDDAFDITSLRLRRGHLGRSHRLLYLADDREVKTESLTKHLQGLPTPLNDEQGSFFFVSFVQGRVLDRCVDPGRSSFQIPDDDESANASLFRVLTWRDLRAGAVEVARVELAEWLDRIFEDKRRRIEAFVAQQEPHYQVLLRDVTEIAADLPPVPSSADIDRAMSRRLFERREKLKVESSRLLSDLEAAEQADPDAYREKMDKAVQEFNELGMADLSRYVCHRRVIIDFLEKALQIQPSSGRYGREDAIHSLIYPMRKTSMDVEFYSHNLWLIDERLAYNWRLYSDLPLTAVDIADIRSGKELDLLIYDHPFMLGTEETPLLSATIIEFKKPMRRNYGRDRVTTQVYNYLELIRSGSYKDRSGRPVRLREDTPVNIYIIGDFTNELVRDIRDTGMQKMPDGDGYYLFNKDEKAYLEVISYDRLLSSAKRRNRAFFKVLGIST